MSSNKECSTSVSSDPTAAIGKTKLFNKQTTASDCSVTAMEQCYQPGPGIGPAYAGFIGGTTVASCPPSRVAI